MLRLAAVSAYMHQFYMRALDCILEASAVMQAAMPALT